MIGAYATWELAMVYPDRFATLMPVAGGGHATRIHFIRHIPQWIHHGEHDAYLPTSRSREMFEGLLEVDALEPKFSTYPGDGPDSWMRAYGNIRVWEWMLGHRRRREENMVQKALARCRGLSSSGISRQMMRK